MFTPPASPLFQSTHDTKSTTNAPDTRHDHYSTPLHPLPSAIADKKVVTRRRTMCTVVLIPLVLMLVSLFSHYLGFPAVFDVLARARLPVIPHNSIPHFAGGCGSHSLPRRGLAVTTASAATTTSTGTASSSTAVISFPTGSPSGSSTPTSSAPVTSTLPPMIPLSEPPLPTPFPQPLESLSRDFKSSTCLDFFVNMTNALPFRACRPFGLLLQSSNKFTEQSQTNISLINDIIWGTCNPPPMLVQCRLNMAWFAENLQTACPQDLKDHTQQVVDTLLGLNAYDLMYQAGCQSDRATLTYCYVEAVDISNPSDVYIYQLPLGTKLPSSTTPTCSPCSKLLMDLYFGALKQNGTSGATAGLAVTYQDAVDKLGRSCGNNFFQSNGAGESGSGPSLMLMLFWALLVSSAGLALSPL